MISDFNIENRLEGTEWKWENQLGNLQISRQVMLVQKSWHKDLASISQTSLTSMRKLETLFY